MEWRANPPLAEKLYKMAANQNSVNALCKLAELYHKGDILGRNLEAACENYQTAANLVHLI